MRTVDMSSVAALLVCFFAGVSAASISRTGSELQTDVTRWNPFGGAVDAVKAAWNPIDKMRGDVCWDREDLIAHEDCMEWLIKKCNSAKGDGKEDGKSSKKRCDKLKAYVTEECDAAGDDSQACKYAKELGISVQASVAPAPAPASAPGPAPGPSGPSPAPAPEEVKSMEAPAPAPAKKEEAAAAPGPAVAFPHTDKNGDGTTNQPQKLQSQGFQGKPVRHTDGKTATSDWHDEYGHATLEAAPRSAAQSSTCMVAVVALISCIF